MDNLDMLKFIGWVVGILLSVNAWYFKEMVSKLSAIQLEIVKLSTEHSLMSDMVKKHDEELDAVREKMFQIELRNK